MDQSTYMPDEDLMWKHYMSNSVMFKKNLFRGLIQCAGTSFQELVTIKNVFTTDSSVITAVWHLPNHNSQRKNCNISGRVDFFFLI